MVMERYIPERGDIVWLNFNPSSGHEQKGKRPAVVISPKKYNEKIGLGLFCPITSKIKNYPFEVKIENDNRVVRKLQFLNNFHIKTAFFGALAPKMQDL